MQKCTSILLVFLLLCATVSMTFGLVVTGKDKRGWTLNSAGYLLGPHAIDNHRTFNEKHGIAGKRELQQEDAKSGNFYKFLSDDNVLNTLLELLSYLNLHLKESEALDNFSLQKSSEETSHS
ncbi:galanin peptides [Hyperolius riggenbachi]|uniref:galanin peptides n=1 Tax=Hyperolius riggenbachi TaxID=752182 RepID=UPI0035A36CA6